MKQLFHVKIVETSFNNFTGELCDIDFVNGEATRSLTENEANRIASILRVNLTPSGEVVTPNDTTPVGENGDTTETTGTEGNTETTNEDAKVVAGDNVFKYTRQELEALADAQGINGLREVANQYGIKGKTINELMDRLLQIQK